MFEKQYKIIGVSPEVSDAELDAAYGENKKRLEEDRFLDGEAGNAAAKELTELNTAYTEVKNYRKEHARVDEEGRFNEIDQAIRADDLVKAQEILDSFNDRPAEWHYMQAVVFYKKNWMNESKKQLEIAKEMAPDNEKYKKTYERLTGKMQSEDKKDDSRFTSGSSGGGRFSDRGGYAGGYDESQQMGGDGCLDFCCRMAICNLCLNCMCNCR